MSALIQDAQQSHSGGSLRDLVGVLFKHQAKILTILIATVAVVAVANFLITPVYETNASLLVKIGREYLSQTAVGEARGVMVGNQEELVNSEVQILESRGLIEKTITTIGVDILYPELAGNPRGGTPPLERAVRIFSEALTAEAVKKSNVIAVSFQHRDPALAAKSLTLLIDYFKEKHLKVFSNPQSSFLEQQLVEYRRRLEASEAALQSFKQQHQIFALEEQRSLLLQQQVDRDSALQNTTNRIEEVGKMVAAYRERRQEIGRDTKRYTQTERDKIVVETQTRLLGLELKAQELLAKGYREDSRSVASVREEITLVKGFLKAKETEVGQLVRTSNPVYQEVEKELLKAEAELASLQAGAATLAEQLAQLNIKIQSLEQNQNELRSLQRELEVNEKNYLTYAEKYEEARISDDLDQQKIVNISVIQAPQTPQEPVKPNKRLNLFLGVILGVLSGLGFAFFFEFKSQTFSTPEQVKRRLRLPVLASITLKDT